MSNTERILYWLIGLLFLVGLGLTTLSWLQVCTEACEQVHFYKYYGWDFELLGFLFFISVTILHFLSAKVNWLGYIVGLMVAGALGNELSFILIQKYVIEQWCPLCLSIAAVIGGIALLIFCRYLYNFKRGSFMKSLGKLLGSLLIIGLGFVMSYYGVFKPEQSFAEGLEGEDVPYFGNQNSPIEVYYITDWFCPACRKIDTKLSPHYNRIMAKARLFFIDYPLHPETMNYVPYNLSFMLKNKNEYFKIRKALHKLSKTTKTPTPQGVQEAVKIYGVTYVPLNFADINEGIKFQEGIVKTFKVKQTPTVVVANRKKLKAKKLSGVNITPANIMKAINDMKNDS
ncbi:MAG: hypothetical protein K940chlam3_01580 [Chlamydiae bacterium]|nr:hypothetical protein [Chlamydiota bacterium]